MEPRRRSQRAALLTAVLLLGPGSISWCDDEIEPGVEWRPPSLGSGQVPALPLPGRSADPARLLEARSFLEAPPVEVLLGRYRLLTDVEDHDLLARVVEATGEAEPLYVSRYGLDPVGEAAETIVLYRCEEDYRRLQDRSERIRGLSSRGHVGWGMVVLYAEGSTESGALVAALRHELTHLLNRRSIGPALPPWLDEGIADDLAAFELDAGLAPRESPLEALRTVEGNRIEIRGTLATLDHLARAVAAGAVLPLPSLLALDWDAFVEEPAAKLHYAASAWLVRYLLDQESGLDHAFRGFLRQVARGGGVGASDLETALGRPWSEIEAGWRRYVSERAAAAGVGAESAGVGARSADGSPRWSGSSSRQLDSPSA